MYYYGFTNFGGWAADRYSAEEAINKFENSTLDVIFASLEVALLHAYSLYEKEPNKYEYLVKCLEKFL